MTNLKPVTEGFNKFCGPAVLSILTGKSTDECARVISQINGQYNVAGVQLSDLVKAADKMGFTAQTIAPQGSLYRTLTTLVKFDGMYIVTVPNHFVVIEVKDKKIYFCDNHTKEPIPAGSSARLGQSVLAVNKVTERERLPEPPKPKMIDDSEIDIEILDSGRLGIDVAIARIEKYDIISDKRVNIAFMHIRNEKELKNIVHGLISKLNALTRDEK